MIKFKTYWIPIFTSLIIAVVVFFLISPKPHRYLVRYDYQERHDINKGSLNFADLNGDRIDEKILTGYNPNSGFLVCLALTAQGGIIEQYNILSEDPGQTQPFFGDYDHDGIREIYIRSKKEGSIYLQQILPYEEQPNDLPQAIYLDSMVCSEGNPYAFMSKPIFEDVDGDGFDEIYFTLVGQYKTHYPRKIYTVDLKTRSKLYESEAFGSMSEIIRFYDLDQDGVNEIIGTSAASANNDSATMYPYSDWDARYMSFDLSLNIIGTPLKFEKEFSRFHPMNQIADIQNELTGIYYHGGRYPFKPYVFQTRSHGQIDRMIEIPHMDYYGGWQILNLRNGLDSVQVVASHKGYVHFYRDSFQLKKTLSFGKDISINTEPLMQWNYPSRDIVGIDLLAEEKVAFYTNSGNLITKHGFNDLFDHIPRIGFTNYYQQGSYFAIRPGLLLYFSFYRNPWYILQWGIIPISFLILFFVQYLIVFIQHRQQKAKNKLMQDMRKLELVGIKNQLDPHFTFNSLNVLSYLSEIRDHDGVQKFTDHFSKLFRRQLEMSDKPSVKLYNELSFVRHFIELQKLRFDIPINYDEEVDSSVDMNLRVPKMMIHTHVENAIKHGLVPTRKGGTIRVSIHTNNLDPGL